MLEKKMVPDEHFSSKLEVLRTVYMAFGGYPAETIKEHYDQAIKLLFNEE